MKKELITNYKNGFTYRANNKRISCLHGEDEDVFILSLENYIKSGHLTAFSNNKRGIARTHLKVSKDTMLAICQGFFEYLQQGQNNIL
tara:strand:- start:1331 stop:1594 length:264 start_codon:yes stop_codon:yes gene_type:complete